ncbi:HAD-superfamily hydrolase, subfamily IIA, CECR5 protein [Actinidia chinensis var. chinensis]|uniref:HAD-superfamily hydrolase, subfamily IIA, CECR5 protein n=1 Tax=Actinidia chinensis var. chinensis TaxID=1590841 RepID=A0A2R6PL44_ACTCC|nr:HAD-superfamily hydrolase, subfamily IIA, CECR5 protein [Actinidia chinensis var. chinensis]
MRFLTVFRVSPTRNWPPLSSFQLRSSWRFFSQLRSSPDRSSFGIAFDIDGVILRGRVPIGGSPQALRRLYGDSGNLKIPFLFLTNGGGIPESRRASELSELLGVKILPSQVVQGHTPFKSLLKRFENELIVVTGKGEPALVMSEYGFKKVLSLDEYAAYFDNIDPVSQYKTWTTKQAFNHHSNSKDLFPRYNVFSDRVKATFVVSDPVDWGRDIQVLCDILRSGGGLPMQNNGQQPPLYFAADDLEYQAAFPAERLGMGAFRIALENIFNRIHHSALVYKSFGKPNSFVFKNAETVLRQIKASCHDDNGVGNEEMASLDFKTLYMIGDNPPVDIKGARQAGDPWFPILTRTGVFRGKENHAEFPADLVVDTVEEAVEYILSKEGNA